MSLKITFATFSNHGHSPDIMTLLYLIFLKTQILHKQFSIKEQFELP